MMMTFRVALGVLLSLGVVTHAGCDLAESPGAVERPGQTPGAEPTSDYHRHATGGPHGGALIELGAGDYHAELVHNEQEGTSAVYLLGPDAASPVPIEAEQLRINVSGNEAARQFELIAAPAEGDPPNASSRFAAAEPELVAALDAAEVEAQLVVTIEGTQYRGEIAPHEHDDEAVR